MASDEAGHPYAPTWVTAHWAKLLSELAIEHVRLHDARHNCGSLMHARGVPPVAIAAWLGHHDPAFTLRTYVHAQSDALKVAGQTFR
ncbi:tyrosine-type recombinase/integrase [Gordonia alkaliphila]|uniref:Tyr recombinase domain-containing protein n=1 Tax=Gordonia alkaliphila TaxID=1053547 RepID=A0ABP8ZEV8_9ACTN